jgi:hypothetical protein
VASRRLRQPPAPSAAAETSVASAAATDALETREALARAARLSNSQVQQIEKIQKQAAPQVVAAVKAGTLSLNAAAVASLPVEEQVAAAAAGKDELKEAARRAREARRRPVVQAPGLEDAAEATGDDSVAALRQRVGELTAENHLLRRQVAELQARLGVSGDSDPAAAG